MYRHIVATELDWTRKMDVYRDWMRRHLESREAWEVARFGAPQPRERACLERWADKDLFLGETVGTDLVAIRIAQISGVGGWRKGTRTGFALIGTSIGKTRFMKLVHRIASW